MIGNNNRDIDMQLVTAVALKQIRQTVVLLRDHHPDAGAPAGQMNFVAHIEHFGDGSEGCRHFTGRNLQSLRRALHPHEKIVRLFVRVMVGVENVAPEIMDESGDAGDDAPSILAVDQQYDRLFSL
jgi:hypothetical protein